MCTEVDVVPGGGGGVACVGRAVCERARRLRADLLVVSAAPDTRPLRLLALLGGGSVTEECLDRCRAQGVPVLVFHPRGEARAGS